MYKYMCVVSDSADKQVYYDTVAELKKRYPDCCEDTTARFGKGTMGQVFELSDDKAFSPKFCVLIDNEKSQVIVFSETYLCSFFDGKNVEEVRKRSFYGFSFGIGILFDIVFLVINFVAAWITANVSLYLVHDEKISGLIVGVALAIIHKLLTICIQFNLNISDERLFFMKTGGWGLLVFIAIGLFYSIELSSVGWGFIAVLISFSGYLRALVPAVLLSAIARFIYNCIKSN